MPYLDDSFTAVGGSLTLPTDVATSASYEVSGTFVGTVALQRTVNGGLSWSTIATLSDVGTVDSFVAEPGWYRWYCTAYTSGTIDCELVITPPNAAVITTAGGVPAFTVSGDGTIILGDGVNIQVGTGTGTKIGTGTDQKLGFFSETPIALPPTITGSTSANEALQILLTTLASEGLIVDGTT